MVTEGGRRHPYWHRVPACGSNAVPLELPGGEAAMRLRSPSDAVILRMAALHADSAVVVGGGLIGCEAASSLARRALSTTLIAPEPVPLLRRSSWRIAGGVSATTTVRSRTPTTGSP